MVVTRFYKLLMIVILSTTSLYQIAQFEFDFVWTDLGKTLADKKKSGEKLSATEAVFLSYYLRKYQAAKDMKNDMKTIFEKISLIELSMEKKEYTTFVHARSWKWNFVNDLWNMIRALEDDSTVISNKITLRHRKKNFDTTLIKKARKKLLKDGVGSYVNSGLDGQDAGSEVIFMNLTLMSNLDFAGECSGWFFFEGYSEGSAQEYIEYLLEEYGLTEYKKSIEDLLALHASANKYGEVITISVSNDAIDDFIYVGTAGGFKYEGILYPQQASKNIAYVKQHADQLAMLSSKKDEYCLYCFVGINVAEEEGVKYQLDSVALTDELVYQKYKKEYKQLFEKIKKDKSAYKHKLLPSFLV